MQQLKPLRQSDSYLSQHQYRSNKSSTRQPMSNQGSQERNSYTQNQKFNLKAQKLLNSNGLYTGGTTDSNEFSFANGMLVSLQTQKQGSIVSSDQELHSDSFTNEFTGINIYQTQDGFQDSTKASKKRASDIAMEQMRRSYKKEIEMLKNSTRQAGYNLIDKPSPPKVTFVESNQKTAESIKEYSSIPNQTSNSKPPSGRKDFQMKPMTSCQSARATLRSTQKDNLIQKTPPKKDRIKEEISKFVLKSPAAQKVYEKAMEELESKFQKMAKNSPPKFQNTHQEKRFKEEFYTEKQYEPDIMIIEENSMDKYSRGNSPQQISITIQREDQILETDTENYSEESIRDFKALSLPFKQPSPKKYTDENLTDRVEQKISILSKSSSDSTKVPFALNSNHLAKSGFMFSNHNNSSRELELRVNRVSDYIPDQSRARRTRKDRVETVSSSVQSTNFDSKAAYETNHQPPFYIEKELAPLPQNYAPMPLPRESSSDKKTIVENKGSITCYRIEKGELIRTPSQKVNMNLAMVERDTSIIGPNSQKVSPRKGTVAVVQSQKMGGIDMKLLEKSIVKKEINLADTLSQSSGGGYVQTRETFENQNEQSFTRSFHVRQPSSKLHLLKEQVHDSLKFGRFDMQLIRKLENQAAIVIQRFFKSKQKPAKDVGCQTEVINQKQLLKKFENQIFYAFILLNMNLAIRKKKKAKRRGSSQSKSPSLRKCPIATPYKSQTPTRADKIKDKLVKIKPGKNGESIENRIRVKVWAAAEKPEKLRKSKAK